MEDSDNNNIAYEINEAISNDESFLEIEHMLAELENMNTVDDETMNEDEMCVAMLDYETNHTVKQLQLICEYYSIKTMRCKKQELIDQIILFENSLENIEIVVRRKELWKYLEELKNDKILKRFILPI
jgi:hypothetical protein